MMKHSHLSSRVLLVVWSIGIVSFFLVFVYSWNQSVRQQQALCRVAQENRAALRDILLLARGSRPLSPEAREFYRRALARAAPLDCHALLNGNP